MAYSKPFSFSFHKQEDFASVFNFNTHLPASPCHSSEHGSSPKSKYSTIPSPTPLPTFHVPFPRTTNATLSKYTDHASHASPGECITECKICKTLYGLDIAAFYWSLMAMYGLPYRGQVSPSLPYDARAKSPLGSACSDSQPPSPASSTGEDSPKESAVYRCNVCQKTYSHPRFLNRHLQSHTPFKKHHCPRCGKGFNDAFDLKRHIRTHTGVKPFKCNLCDKSFTQRCSLEAHSTRVHGIAHKFSFRERRPKVYVCEECGETFQDNSKFRQHAKDHGSCGITSQIIGFKWSRP